MALTRKEIRISDASLSYLQSDELAEAFCFDEANGASQLLQAK